MISARARGLWTPILAAAVLPLAMIGCGGGDDGSTTVGTPLSKPDFVAQADSICTDETAEAQKAAEERFGDQTPSDEQIQSYVDEVLVPNLEDQANQIDELGAPTGDDDQVGAIVDALRSGIDELENDPTILTDGDGTAFAEANKLAADYGLDACAN
ncbi:MAG: hypothetical protein ACR2K6_10475 [Solirubrobacterales bacterium]